MVTGENLTIDDVVNVALFNYSVRLSEGAIVAIKESHDAVLEMMISGKVAYGVTTGFGSLCDKMIDHEQTSQLSRNIIVSHSVGVGKPMPIDWVKAGILVRINALSRGYSGVSFDTINAMIGLLNHNIIPVIPMYGSLACSGDLCPLSHMALVISEPIEPHDTTDNEVFYNGMRMLGADAMRAANVKKSRFGPKEGLAVTNGSTFTAGIGCLCYYYASKIYKQSIASLSLCAEAMLAVPTAFDSEIHELRNQTGQIDFARSFRFMTEGSKLLGTSKKIQDAYSFRCAAQVQGVLCDRLEEFEKMLTNEINAVTDNPILITKNNVKTFVSGGNFNGSYIGQYAEAIKVSLCEIGAITERRIARLVDDTMSRGLPSMLVENPGIEFRIYDQSIHSSCSRFAKSESSFSG